MSENNCCPPPSVGPAGPRGPAGPVGPVGPQGPVGALGGVALSAVGGLISSGTASFVDANGVSFIRNGQSFSASVAPQTSPVASWYDNMPQATNSVGIVTFSAAGIDRTLRVVPLEQHFPFDITAGTFMMDVSLSDGAATLTSAYSYTVSIGVYTSTGATLSLLNSASVSFGFVADANNSDSIVGQRFLTVPAANWSSSPVFREGSQYFLGTLHSTSGRALASFTILGKIMWSSGVRSGSIGNGSVADTTKGFAPFYGVFTTTIGSMPASIANSDLGKTSVAGRAAVPHLVMINEAALSVF